MKSKNLLVTGMPGSGKTTLLMRLAEKYPAVGFYTEEIRQEGGAGGFPARRPGRERGDSVACPLPWRAADRALGVDIPAFENFLRRLDLLSATSALVFIDEIGKMECLSRRFIGLVEQLLDSQATVVATVAAKGEGLIASVKERPDCELVQVSPANREALVDKLAGWIRERRVESGTY